MKIIINFFSNIKYMTSPILCLWNGSDLFFSLYEDLGLTRQKKNSLGNPIFIRTVSDIVMLVGERPSELSDTRPISFNGHQGYVKHTNCKPLGIFTAETRMVRTDFRDDTTWVQSRNGRNLAINTGTLVAILGQTKLYARAAETTNHPLMTQIGFYNETGLYSGYVRDEYLNRISRSEQN